MTNGSVTVATVVLTLVSYVAIFLFWPAVAVVVAAWVVFLAARGWRRAAIATVLVSPFVVLTLASASRGVIDYVNGTGRLLYVGMPGDESSNLDRELRCGRRSSGCIRFGCERFTQSPNNFAIAAMIRTFGPMSGSYVGTYPSRAEARALIKTSRTLLKHEAIESGEILVAGRKIRLEPPIVGEVSCRIDSADGVKVALDEDCLLFGPGRWDDEGSANGRTILLVDATTSRRIARYTRFED